MRRCVASLVSAVVVFSLVVGGTPLRPAARRCPASRSSATAKRRPRRRAPERADGPTPSSPSASFDPVNGVDDDGNGYVDDTNGWDFANGDARSTTVARRAASTSTAPTSPGRSARWAETAPLPVELRERQRRRGCVDHGLGREVVVLQLRRDQRRHRCPRLGHLLDAPVQQVRLVQRHVDGNAPRDRRDRSVRGEKRWRKRRRPQERRPRLVDTDSVARRQDRHRRPPERPRLLGRRPEPRERRAHVAPGVRAEPRPSRIVEDLDRVEERSGACSP